MDKEHKCLASFESKDGIILAFCYLDKGHKGLHNGITYYGRFVEWLGTFVKYGEAAF